MSWPASIFSALLTALLGMFVSGTIAAMAVDWYRIPSREGASGYFVISLGLMGFMAGLILGLIVARVVAGGTHPGFLRATGISMALVGGIGLLSGGVTRALADVPPTLDGDPLLLMVEVRWPAGQTTAPVALGDDAASLGLHSIPHFSHTVRASESGPLWMEDAHLVDGRWVVPGAVDVFTSRGTRMLTVNTGDKNTQGFQVPLAAFPRRKDLAWSDWLPDFRPGVTVPPGLLSFRYRVQKVGQPIRTDTLGPFEVVTSSYGFHQVQQEKRTYYASASTFGIRYRGQPLGFDGTTPGQRDTTEGLDRVDEVSLLPGPRPALLLHVDSPTSSGSYYLVTEEGERVRIDSVASGSRGMTGRLLTSDTALFRAVTPDAISGWIDRTSYARPGLYRIGLAVLDTRVASVRRFKADSSAYGIPAVPPLGLSPDERSFVVFGHEPDTAPPPLLIVTDVVADSTYKLPVDTIRMRYAKFESLDPAWLDHHFEWRRGADGVDRLAERPHFTPLPWRGELTVEGDGHRTYRLEKGTEGLRAGLIAFLVKEFNAVPQPADSGAYKVPVTIQGRTVEVAFSSEFGYVAVTTTEGTAEDATLVETIARRFDAALATGKYDDLIGQ